MSRFLSFLALCTAVLIGALPTGCKSSGSSTLPLWELTTPTTSSIQQITPSVVLNKTSLGAAIRAAINTTGAQLTLTLNNGTTVTLTATADSGSQITFQTASAVDVSHLTVSGSNYVLNVTCVINGISIPLDLRVPTGLGGTTSTATSTAITTTVTLTTDSSGKITYTYTVTYIPVGQTVSTTTGTQQPGTNSSPVTLPDFHLEKVTAVSGTTETVLSQVETESVSPSRPVFRLYFNKALSAIPSLMSLHLQYAGGTQTFNTSSANSLSAALSTDGKILTLSLLSSTGNPLSVSTSYVLTFGSVTISSSASSATVSLSSSQAYKFRTSTSTTVASTTLGIEKVTWFDSGSNIDRTLSTSNTGNVPYLQPVFRVYFNAQLAGVPATYSMCAATASGTTCFRSENGSITMTLSTDKTYLSAAFPTTATLLPNTTYQLTFNSGIITALANASTTTTLKNGLSYLITTQAATTTTSSVSAVVIDRINWVNPKNSSETTLSTSYDLPNVSFTNPVFKVYFQNPIKEIPATFSVTAATVGTSAAFLSTNSAVSATLSTDRKTLSLTLSGQSTLAKLVPYTSYTVSFDSAPIVDFSNASGTGSLKNNLSYKIQTKKTELSSWDTQAYVSSAWTTTKSGSTVSSSTTRVVLTFDYPVTVPTDLLTSTAYQVTKKVGTTTTTAPYKDYFNNTTSSGTSIIQDTVKTMTKGSYTVTFSSGTFTDAAGKPVDTTASATFTVQ